MKFAKHSRRRVKLKAMATRSKLPDDWMEFFRKQGKKGGKIGGKARAAALSPAKRKEIAKKAAAKRWEKN